jgi:lysophospholipase L1-like esterase
MALLVSCGRGADEYANAQASAQADADANANANANANAKADADANAGAGAGVVPSVFRMGRFDDASPRGPVFAWSGSTLRARFSGAGVSVLLRDDTGRNFFRVRVDDKTSVFSTAKGEQRYSLGVGLGEGAHTVEIVKRTEARSGEVQFLGFDFDGGELLPGAPHKTRHIEVLGDSISTGWGVLGVDDVACPDAAKLTDETQTAGALAAEMLDAEHTTIAWSAKTIREIALLWERTLPGHDDSRWDFSDVPDAVVVNLGTNDFYTGDPGLSAFETRYLALLDKIRARYKQSFVVAILGPMMSDAYPENKRHYTLARSYLTHAVAAAKTKGDARIAMLDFGPADPHDGYGCRFHPSPKTQRKLADDIVRVLRENLSW